MSHSEKILCERLEGVMHPNTSTCSAYTDLVQAIGNGREYGELKARFIQELEKSLPNSRSMFRSTLSEYEGKQVAKQIADLVVTKWEAYKPNLAGKKMGNWGAPSDLPGALHGYVIIGGGGICM